MKNIVLNHLTDQDFFAKSIRSLFRKGLIPSTLAQSPEEIDAGVHDLYAFIKQAKIVKLDENSGEIFEVNTLTNEFRVNTAHFRKYLKYADQALLHEAIHRMARDKLLADRMNVLNKQINDQAPFTPQSLTGNIELQKSIREWIRLHGEIEARAYDATFAMMVERTPKDKNTQGIHRQPVLRADEGATRALWISFFQEFAPPPRTMTVIYISMPLAIRSRKPLNRERSLPAFKRQVMGSVLQDPAVRLFKQICSLSLPIWEGGRLP